MIEMSNVFRSGLAWGCCMLGLASSASTAWSATPTAEQALKLAPIQKEVEFDRPLSSEASKCTIKSEKLGEHTGWVVRDAAGQVLRRFLDTDGDNVVDQWCYFDHGVETYRDIDSNFNGKADQYRWFNLAGSRWGIDADEDEKIDSWKSISAEEVTAEVVAALAHHDEARFACLLLSSKDLQELGLEGAKADDLASKIKEAPAQFKALRGKHGTITAKTTWTHFGGTRPGVVPAGTEGASKDLLVYENVVAMVETEGQHGQVMIGTMIKVGDGWRVVAAPFPVTEGQADLPDGGVFFQAALTNRTDSDASGEGPDAKAQALLAELEKLDAEDSSDQSKTISRRTELLEQIAAGAGSPEEKAQWLRQLADTVSAAVQAGIYDDGAERLKALEEKLTSDSADETLAAYVKFRRLTAEYGLALQAPRPDFTKIQTHWLENLKKYVDEYPSSPDTVEAMLQLAMAEEFAGQDDEARRWFEKIVQDFPDTPTAKKAAGAVTRLGVAGKVLDLKGTGLNGKTVDLAQYRKKVVLVQYWATWCEPALEVMDQIKELQAKYGKDGLVIIGVSLDNKKQDLEKYLKKNALPWTQIFEPGGLESRLANEMGILTLPTMILVDQKGKVVNRNIHITEIDKEVKSLLR